jgi:hypothetical protein
VSTTCFADSDHAGCKVTQQSLTDILVFAREPSTDCMVLKMSEYCGVKHISLRLNCVEDCSSRSL